MVEIYIILSLILGIGIGYTLANQNKASNEEMENRFKALALDINETVSDSNSSTSSNNKLNQLDDALLHFRKALEINPNHYKAHNNIGTIFWRIGELDKAKFAFQKV